MFPWTIGEGGLIRITFTQPLNPGCAANNESHFTVSWQEYDYVPNGHINVNKSFSPIETFQGDTEYNLILEMDGLQRFNNAAGDIYVSYDGAGSLAGSGGPVEPFNIHFTPHDLVMKPNQYITEHIDISNIVVSGPLTRIYYTNAYETEHLNITNITVIGTLTHVDDL